MPIAQVMEAASSLIAGSPARSIPPPAAPAPPAPEAAQSAAQAAEAAPREAIGISGALAHSAVFVGDVVAAADLALASLGEQHKRTPEAETRLAALRAEAADLVAVLRRAQEIVEPAGPAASEPAPVAEPSAPAARAAYGASKHPYSFAGRAQPHEPRSREPGRRPCSAAAVRLLATQMAVSGSRSDEIERRLKAEFGVAEPALIVPDILAKAAAV